MSLILKVFRDRFSISVLGNKFYLTFSFFCVTVIFSPIFALAIESGTIYDGRTLNELSLEKILDEVRPGDVLLVGEQHGAHAHHQLQQEIVQGIIDRGQTPYVGIEHFSHLEQRAMDAYFRGDLSEKALLKTVTLDNFQDYKEILFLAINNGGWSYGVNAPRWLTRKINAVGYDNLSDLERQILPEDFSVGSEDYKNRILDLFGGTEHGQPNFQRFFEAQSAWDDTSAEQVIKITESHPDGVHVIVFGDFHIAYGGGLPDRLKDRGFNQLKTFSQVCKGDRSEEELEDLLAPDSRPAYGQRADYVRSTDCNQP